MTTITASLATCAAPTFAGGGTTAPFKARVVVTIAETKTKENPMSNDYTLPPVPDHPEPRHMRWSELERKAIADYGLICSYKAREPLIEENARLLARIAELERSPSEFLDARRAWLASDAIKQSAIDRLCADVEALRSVLTECADDLEAEVNARASGDLPHRIERDLDPVRKARALLAQPSTSWVNPLAAEVDALTAANAALVASNDAMREDAERYIHLKSIAKVGITKRQEFVITLDLVPCPGHIGMLDLALDADRNNKEPTPE